MGKVIYTTKNKEMYELYSTRDIAFKTVRDEETKKIKRIKTENTPLLELNKTGGTMTIEVTVSSTESDDTELLHKLYRLGS